MHATAVNARGGGKAGGPVARQKGGVVGRVLALVRRDDLMRVRGDAQCDLSAGVDSCWRLLQQR